MNFFLDCEFTHLTGPRLISIALVSETGDSFYREIADRWRLRHCSLFVLAWILPLLADGKAAKTLRPRLGRHLDLVQSRTDYDRQFSAAERPLLEQECAADRLRPA